MTVYYVNFSILLEQFYLILIVENEFYYLSCLIFLEQFSLSPGSGTVVLLCKLFSLPGGVPLGPGSKEKVIAWVLLVLKYPGMFVQSVVNLLLTLNFADLHMYKVYKVFFTKHISMGNNPVYLNPKAFSIMVTLL